MGETNGIIETTDIKTDVNKMKQYLKDIYTLEKELYCSKQAQNKIANTINGLGIKQQFEKPQTDEYDIGSILLSLIVCVGLGAGIGYFISEEFFDSYLFVFIGMAIGAVILFLIIKHSYDENKYKMNGYNTKIAMDESRVEKELSLVPELRKNENLYSQNIISCQDSLQQLYSLDIIFPKYRNFIAISQIYEYYMSGRCTELEGHEGAYNIFESELRQNVIISQLNDVLSNLEEIKQTQYMIYDAICFANSQLAQIESNTAAIAYNSSVIAENTAICARYRDIR